MTTDTAQLVQNAAGGDIDSFGELCRQHYAAMIAVAFAVLNDHQLAEDAAQEAFARALVNLGNLKDAERFAPWLAAICRNIANDMAKAKIREKQVAWPQAKRGHVDTSTQGRNFEAVARAVSALPADLKELVVMRYYDGLSYEQISTVLGISQPAINGRLTRAKRKIAKILKNSDVMKDAY